MAAVDTNDNMRARYFSQKSAKKWWHAIFYWMIDVACINAYILWCLKNGKDRRKHSKNSGRYQFIMAIVKSLAGIDDDTAHNATPASRRFSSPNSVAAGRASQMQSPGSDERPSKRPRNENSVEQEILTTCNAPVFVPCDEAHNFGIVKCHGKCDHCIKECRLDRSTSNKARMCCLTCKAKLCPKHWAEWPPHQKYYDDNKTR